jgi:ubiquinone/menaquinone biosynthesis C-methylase UbiE
VRTRVDYNERQHSVYSRGRTPSPRRVELWTRVFQRYIDPDARLTILDLGSGIGTWSEVLAEAFRAQVVGVEPAARMRAVAAAEHAHPRVRYVEGAGERIPLAAHSCDAALLSYVIHHVADRDACAAELRRVLRPGAVVLVRGALRDSLPAAPHWRFFPAARAIAEGQFPSVDEVLAVFGRHGFEHVTTEVLEQETAPSLRAWHERLKLRAVSTLELLSDADFEAGIERLRLAADAEQEPQPVTEQVLLLVLRSDPATDSPREGAHTPAARS